MLSATAQAERGETRVIGRRAAAFAFDVVVVTALTSLIVVPLRLAAQELSMVGQSGLPLSASVATALGVAWLYFTVPEGLFGCTVGKLAMGLHVICLTSGGRPTFRQAAVRNLGRLIEAALLGVPAVVAIATSPRHQRMGDRWADTAVVSRQR